MVEQEKQWKEEELQEFKEIYLKNKKEKIQEFEFKGRIYGTTFAYYLIDYLESYRIKQK